MRVSDLSHGSLQVQSISSTQAVRKVSALGLFPLQIADFSVIVNRYSLSEKSEVRLDASKI